MSANLDSLYLMLYNVVVYTNTAAALQQLLEAPEHVPHPQYFPWLVQHASAFEFAGEGPFMVIDLARQRFKVELYRGWVPGVICGHGHFHLAEEG